jgi:hypothetical protein
MPSLLSNLSSVVDFVILELTICDYYVFATNNLIFSADVDNLEITICDYYAFATK